jgi:hypothetical protein
MGLKAVVDDISTVDEALRGLYEEKDGKHVLSLDEFDTHPSVSGLKSAFGKTKQEINDLKNQYKDVDPARYSALVAQERELLDRAEANTPEKIRARVAEEWQARMNVVETERNGYRDKFHNVALTDRVKTAALAAGVIPADVDDVVQLTRKQFELDETSLKVIVRDADGSPTGETLEQFFRESFKTKKPKFYVASVGTGGGATGSGVQNSKGDIVITKEQGKDVPFYRKQREEAIKRGVKLIVQE